jgi:hypothetical protein
MPWSDSALSDDFRVAYTDADTIKAVAEEKLEGGVVGIKPKWVGL